MKSKRHTLSEREKYLDLVYDQIEAGKSTTSAVKAVGISIASFYRWEEEIKGANYRRVHFGESRLPSVDESIRRLVEYENCSEIDRLVAIFRLRAWMLWPTERVAHEPAVAACLLTYARKDSSTVYLADIDRELLDAISNHIRIDIIRAFYDWDANVGPRFEELRQHNFRYSDRDVVAEVVRYFLFTVISGNKIHSKPSLNKAKDVIDAGMLNTSLGMSDRTFDSYWKKYAPSSPFIYVNNYATNLSWEFDPTSNESEPESKEEPNETSGHFMQYVEELMVKRVEVVSYMARCKFVTEIMKRNLDRRALQNLQFPNFPEHLEPEPVSPPPIDPLRKK